MNILSHFASSKFGRCNQAGCEKPPRYSGYCSEHLRASCLEHLLTLAYRTLNATSRSDYPRARGLRQLKKHSDELQEKVSNLGYDAGVEAKKMLGKKFDYVKIRNILQKVRFRAANTNKKSGRASFDCETTIAQILKQTEALFLTNEQSVLERDIKSYWVNNEAKFSTEKASYPPNLSSSGGGKASIASAATESSSSSVPVMVSSKLQILLDKAPVKTDALKALDDMLGRWMRNAKAPERTLWQILRETASEIKQKRMALDTAGTRVSMHDIDLIVANVCRRSLEREFCRKLNPHGPVTLRDVERKCPVPGLRQAYYVLRCGISKHSVGNIMPTLIQKQLFLVRKALANRGISPTDIGRAKEYNGGDAHDVSAPGTEIDLADLLLKFATNQNPLPQQPSKRIKASDYCWYHLTQALLQFYKESCVQEGSNDESGGSTTFDKFMSSYRQQCFKSFKRLARRKARALLTCLSPYKPFLDEMAPPAYPGAGTVPSNKFRLRIFMVLHACGMLFPANSDQPTQAQQKLELEMARLIQMQLEEEWAQAMDCLCLLHYAHYDGCHRSIWFEKMQDGVLLFMKDLPKSGDYCAEILSKWKMLLKVLKHILSREDLNQLLRETADKDRGSEVSALLYETSIHEIPKPQLFRFADNYVQTVIEGLTKHIMKPDPLRSFWLRTAQCCERYLLRPVPPTPFRVGMIVEVNYKDQGKVIKLHPNGTYDIHYPEGRVDRHVSETDLRDVKGDVSNLMIRSEESAKSGKHKHRIKQILKLAKGTEGPSGWSDLYSLHLFDPEKRQLRELLQQQGVLRSVALYILDDHSTSAASDARVPEIKKMQAYFADSKKWDRDSEEIWKKCNDYLLQH